jgi:hypothetical protein
MRLRIPDTELALIAAAGRHEHVRNPTCKPSSEPVGPYCGRRSVRSRSCERGRPSPDGSPAYSGGAAGLVPNKDVNPPGGRPAFVPSAMTAGSGRCFGRLRAAPFRSTRLFNSTRLRGGAEVRGRVKLTLAGHRDFILTLTRSHKGEGTGPVPRLRSGRGGANLNVAASAAGPLSLRRQR